MKKINLLLFTLFGILFFGVTDVNAATYSKEFKDWEEKLEYKISITSDALEEGLTFNCNQLGMFAYVDDNMSLYSKYIYSFDFSKMATKITSLNSGTATILIEMPNLTENEVYDVYYVDNLDNNFHRYYTIDTSLNGNTATVVKLEGKLYIRLTTSSLKSFILNQRTTNGYTNKVNKITKNDVLEINALEPANYEFFDEYAYFNAINNKSSEYSVEPVINTNADGGDKLYLKLTFNDRPNESHLVEYKYIGVSNSKVVSLLDEIVESLRDENSPMLSKRFVVEDLNYINYLYNINDDSVDIIYYSSELRNMFKGTNLVPFFDYRAGDNTEFMMEAFGMVVVSYKGTLYPLGIDTGYTIKSVIYVPEATQDDDQALIRAAKERIVKYLGIEEKDISLTVGGTRTSLNEVNWEKYDLDNISDNYYNLTINNKTVKIVIEKNDDKIKNLDFITRDLLTDIQISSVSGSIPLDTFIEAKQITSESDKFKEILDKIGKDTGLMFDLKLFSSSLDKYVTKLNNTEFLVSIPLIEEYKGKELSAYFVGDDGKIEEYKITIKDNYAQFITSHFSTYTIAESSSINNPKTGDGILNILLIGSISLMGILGTGFYLRKKALIK